MVIDVKLAGTIIPYWVQTGLAESNKTLETVLRPEEFIENFSKKDLGSYDTLNMIYAEEILSVYYGVHNPLKNVEHHEGTNELYKYKSLASKPGVDVSKLFSLISVLGGEYREFVEGVDLLDINVRDYDSKTIDLLVGRILPEGYTFKLEPKIILDTKNKLTYKYDTFLVFLVKLVKLEDVLDTSTEAKQLMDLLIKHDVGLPDVAKSGLLDLL